MRVNIYLILNVSCGTLKYRTGANGADHHSDVAPFQQHDHGYHSEKNYHGRKNDHGHHSDVEPFRHSIIQNIRSWSLLRHFSSTSFRCITQTQPHHDCSFKDVTLAQMWVLFKLILIVFGLQSSLPPKLLASIFIAKSYINCRKTNNGPFRFVMSTVTCAIIHRHKP